jgi:N-acetylneuraminic acid mutarotase
MRHIGLASFVFLAACGGGGGSSNNSTSTPPPASNAPPPPVTTVGVRGAVQKGPFIVGSTVLVNKLDAQGRPTDSTVVTEVNDSIGSFSFNASSPGPVQIVATGYYFSELTGNVSNGSLTLKALYNVGGASTQSAYVNILTHLINNRVLELMSNSQLTMSNAIAQAEREFIAAFSPALPVGTSDSFSALSLYNVAGTSDGGNAYLLALSTGFYKYAALRAEEFGSAVDAELTLILNQIAEDLRDDGSIQRAGFISDFTHAIRSLSPTEIAANLRRRSIADYPQGLGVPDISRFIHHCAGTAECVWSSGAPMPEPSRGHAAVLFGNKVYVFGGDSPAGQTSSAYAKTRVFDPGANTWTTKTPMPVGSYAVQAYAVGSKIYVFPSSGLNGFQNDVLEYDPVADSWVTKASSPTYRYSYSSAAINGKIYLLAGDGTIDDGPWVSGKEWIVKSHVEIYDPATDLWSTGASAPAPFAGAATCAIGDEIYMFGGNDSDRTPHAATWVYNVTTNSWSARSPLSAPRWRAGCVRIGDHFYVFSGSEGATVAEAVSRYDPATDAWTVPSRLANPRMAITGVAVGSKIILLGGMTPALTQLDAVDILDTAI